jgi:hypothetical protein
MLSSGAGAETMRPPDGEGAAPAETVVQGPEEKEKYAGRQPWHAQPRPPPPVWL